MYNTRSLTKYVLLCLLFTASFSAKAQFSTVLGNFRTYNNTAITVKTGPKSITPINVGGNIDSTARYLLWLNTLIGGATGFQGTLNTGNTASTSGGGVASFQLQGTGVVAQYNDVNTGGVFLSNHSGAQPCIAINSGGGAQPHIDMFDLASGFSNNILSAPLTANRATKLTDEGGNIALQNHDNISGLTPYTVFNSTYTTYNTGSGFRIRENSSGLYVFQTTSSFGNYGLQMRYNSTAFTGTVSCGVLTANRNYAWPDRGGTLALQGDGINPVLTAGAAIGTSPAIAFVGAEPADDNGFLVTVTPGAGGVAGVIFNIVYNTPYLTTPHVTLTPANVNAAAVAATTWAPAGTGTGFHISSGIGLVNGTVYQWRCVITQ